MAEKLILSDLFRPPDLISYRGQAWNIDLVREIDKESRSKNPNLVSLWLLESLDMNIYLPHSKLEIREISTADRGNGMQNFNFRLANLEPDSAFEPSNLMEASEFRLISGGNFYSKNIPQAQALGVSAMIGFVKGELEPHERSHQSWSHHFIGS